MSDESDADSHIEPHCPLAVYEENRVFEVVVYDGRKSVVQSDNDQAAHPPSNSPFSGGVSPAPSLKREGWGGS